MMNIERNAFVVSPHQDDAALSIGMLLQRYKRVDVVNLFTRSNSHILADRDDDVESISQLRKEEDQKISDNYGFMFHDAGFDDCEVRGVAWDDYWATIDPDLVDEVERAIFNILGEENTDIYIPSGFGMHPDHLIAHAASMRVIKQLAINAWFLYADQPYYNNPSSVRLRAHDILSVGSRITVPFDKNSKKDMLGFYPSQLSSERVENVSEAAGEYIWEGTHELLTLSSSGIQNDRYQQVPSAFGSRSWHDASIQCRPYSRHILCETVSVDGHVIEIPIMIENHVVEEKPVTMVRLEGAGWFDYADFMGAEHLDQSAWRYFIANFEHDTASVLWLSGIREDSALYRLLESNGKTGYLFSGESSFVLDCNNDGYDAWYKSLSQKMRQKVRRTGRKKEEFLGNGGTIDIHQATTEDIDVFLKLQQQRAEASDGKLDPFIDDAQYCAFMKELALRGELSCITMESNQKTIGMILFHYQPSQNDTLSIINQGFDPEYSNYSPGFMMQLELIKLGHRQKLRVIDYLKGAEPYKREFTNREVKLFKYLQPLDEIGDEQWIALKKFGEAYVE